LVEPSVPVGSQFLDAQEQELIPLALQPLAPLAVVMNGMMVVIGMNVSSALASGVKATDIHLETGSIMELDDGLFVKKRSDGSIEVYVSEDV
jgi:hypothetical protein